jgi:hypothetical protein
VTGPGEFLAAHGPMLLIGATALLSGGTIAIILQRSPIHRQRIAELTLICVPVWAALACIPLPRWSTPDRTAPATPARASIDHAGVKPPGTSKRDTQSIEKGRETGTGKRNRDAASISKTSCVPVFFRAIDAGTGCGKFCRGDEGGGAF